MKIEKKKFRGIIISSTIIGLIADKISLSDGHQNIFLGTWIGFVIFIPLIYFVALKIIELIKLKNKTAILTLKIFIPIIFIILTVLIMIFGFAFYDFREGPGSISDMYGMMYLLGFIPSLIIGLAYGLFISINLKGE